jgi:hypothetical protein
MSDNKDIDRVHVVEQVIEKGANAAEEIHRAVSDIPVAILENLGLEEAATETRKIQDRSIGVIYRLIRVVNHQVTELATDLLEQREKFKQDHDE